MPSAKMQKERGQDEADGGRKAKQKQKQKKKKQNDDELRAKQETTRNTKNSNNNNKSLVDELKLFQNSNLLNQQDPLEQLHQQINQLIRDDDLHHSKATFTRLNHVQQFAGRLQTQESRVPELEAGQSASLSTPPIMQYNHLGVVQQHQQTAMGPQPNAVVFYDGGQDVFTVKKGVLWQQQNYEKFHQRLFSRWKKRYFILTTDYLVCFKRSSSRVGHSEMGRFLYKIALTDVAKTGWLRPKRKDKGPIVLHVKSRFELLLWSKREIDEWMLLIDESIHRLKLRRSAQLGLVNGHHQIVPAASGANLDRLKTEPQHGVYENAFASGGQSSDIRQIDGANASAAAAGDEARECATAHETQSTIGGNSSSSRTKTCSRTSSGSRRLTNNITSNSNGGTPLRLPEAGPIERESVKGQLNAITTGVDGSVGGDGDGDGDGASGAGGSSEQESRRAILQQESNEDAPLNDQPCKQAARRRSQNAVLSPALNDGAASGRTETGQQDDLRANSSLGRSQTEGRHLDKLIESERQISGNSVGSCERRKQADEVADKQRGADVRESGHANLDGAPGNKVGGRKSTRPPGWPAANLIRRDDSWHSLVSLTHVGEQNMQAGQKQSPCAPHNPGPTNDALGSRRAQAGGAQWHRRPLNIESTATPLRGRLGQRQHSIQAYSRRLAPIGRQQAQSFDVPSSLQVPSSPSLVHANNQQTASHLQKLLQLQLLHNSNNVDYIRANDNGQALADYQLYGPGSIATNHYGYYSMRSNLKSAASEFSFIRPNSSSFVQHQAQPSAVAQKSPKLAHDGPNSSYVLSEQAALGSQRLMKPLASAAAANVSFDHNNNSYPNGPMLGPHLASSQGGGDQFQQAYENALRQRVASDPEASQFEPVAPNRDLPLKPNRKRATNSNESRTDKNSLGSSIVYFFRRAFSRRQKRRPKLVGSCSSSLAAFDSNLDPIQVSQSAFSTGSKSARAERAPMTAQPIGQPQRMIDLIEAFANKTALEQKQTGIASMQTSSYHQSEVVGVRERDNFGSIRPKFIRDQVGSPLHKSNSISTSSGFSGLNEFVQRNQRFAHSAGYTGASGQMPSPLVTRSTKVMSANLTPLFARKGAFEDSSDEARSPRDMRRLPRPSSIYGQPSLISSPVVQPNTARGNNELLGLHRNSAHGNGHREQRVARGEQHFRRQRTINAPFLDTTREVAEELASPVGEMRAFLPTEQLYDHEINARLSYSVQDTSLTRAHKIGAYYRHPRQAVVNPIIQSPTLGAIYDNHSGPASQSHYDNHDDDRRAPMNYHDPDRDESGYSQPRVFGRQPGRAHNQHNTGLGSPLIHSRSQAAHPFVNHSALYTPTRDTNSHSSSRQNQLVRSATTENDRLFVRSRPAAIVAPTTPHRQASYAAHLSQEGEEEARLVAQASPSIGGGGGRFIGQPSAMRAQQQASPNAATVSPIGSRRSINQTQFQYQQSPLVDEQTRVLRRAGRVQTTIIAADSSENVEPTLSEPGSVFGFEFDRTRDGSLAHDANRATATSDDNKNNQHDKRHHSNAKTSRHPAYILDNTFKNEVTDCTGLSHDKTENQTASAGSSQEEQSLSTGNNSSDNSSLGHRSHSNGRLSITDQNAHSDKVERATESLDDESNKGNTGEEASRATSRSLGSKRRGSSNEQSDDSSSQLGSLDEHVEKNWINSKLVQ